jgi:diaminopimelate epimerase
MCWYEIIDKTDKSINITSTKTSSIQYTSNEVKEIERTKVYNPTIVQVGIPHNIIDVTEDRLCISLVPIHKFTSKRVTMTESIEIFKDYLIEDQL